MSGGSHVANLLVDAYIRRINAYDKNGPAINSIVTLNPNFATKERRVN